MSQCLRKIIFALFIFIVIYSPKNTYAKTSHTYLPVKDGKQLEVLITPVEVFESVPGSDRYLVAFEVESARNYDIQNFSVKISDKTNGSFAGDLKIKQINGYGHPLRFYRFLKFAGQPDLEDIEAHWEFTCERAFNQLDVSSDKCYKDILGTDTYKWSRGSSYEGLHGYVGTYSGRRLKRDGTFKFKVPKDTRIITAVWCDGLGRVIETTECKFIDSFKAVKIRPKKKLKRVPKKCFVYSEAYVSYYDKDEYVE